MKWNASLSVAISPVCATFLLLSLLLPATALATPRQSLTSGSPCSTCHVNKQGGAMRTEIGWGSSAYTGLFLYEDIGLDSLADLYSNRILDSPVSVGIDARVQMARFGRPTVELGDDGEAQTVAPTRRIFPMQFQPYVAVELLDWLKAYGTFALGPDTFSGDICATPYPGQSCYSAQAIIEPSPELPSFRVGMFQPSIGLRHDDHTMLIRQDVSRDRGNLIPVNYAELGLEASYQPRYWLKADAGAFRAANLSDAIGQPDIVSPNDVAYLGRLSLLPRFELGDASLFGTFGLSGYGAGQFHLQNLFLGFGLLDRASLILEAARFTEGSSDDKRGLNLSATLAIPAREWLVFEGRVERGLTTVNNTDTFETRAAVVGLSFYPIPYVKLQPQYRITQTDDYAIGQYTAQLHLFF